MDAPPTNKPPAHQVAPQTKIAFVGYMLLAISMVIALIQNPGAAKGGWAALGMYLVIFGLSAYVVNCTVVGSCHVYAWVVGYLVVIGGFMSVLGVLVSLLRK